MPTDSQGGLVSRNNSKGCLKKIDHHVHAKSLNFMYYNFCRKHETLTKPKGGVHTTPAMAAGVTDRVWEVSDIIALLVAKEAVVLDYITRKGI